MTAKHVASTVSFGVLGWLVGVALGYLVLVYAPDVAEMVEMADMAEMFD